MIQVVSKIQEDYGRAMKAQVMSPKFLWIRSLTSDSYAACIWSNYAHDATGQ